jgi:hypothetical protein
LLARAAAAAGSLFAAQPHAGTAGAQAEPAAAPEAQAAPDDAATADDEGDGMGLAAPAAAAKALAKAAPQRLRLNDKNAAAGTELDKSLAEWVRRGPLVNKHAALTVRAPRSCPAVRPRARRE